MANIKELLGERYTAFLKADTLIKAAKRERKDLSPDDSIVVDGCIARIREIDNELDKQETAGRRFERDRSFPDHPSAQAAPPVSLPGSGNGPVIGRDAEGKPVPVFSKGQSIEAFTRQQNGFNNDGITLGELARGMVTGHCRPEVRAALNEGADSAGGVTVPYVLSTMLIDQLRARSTVFAAGARTMLLDTGKATTLTAIASDPVSAWKAENAAVATSDMTFSPVTLTPKTLAVMLIASREIVEDGLLLEQAIITSLSKSFAAELDRVALFGTGSSNQPLGVANVSGIGSYSMGTNGAALTNYDPFVQALGLLQTANASDPTALIYHPRSAQEINLLKDTQNRPLARPACLENLPFMVTSKLPINMTQGSANTASLAILGNFPELIVGIRHNFTLEILREKYADNYQVGFLASLRADIAVCHAASFAKVIGIL